MRINLYKPRMLLDDNVVSNGQAKASALSSGFRREERIEDVSPDVQWDAGTVVAYPNLNFVAEIFLSSPLWCGSYVSLPLWALRLVAA